MNKERAIEVIENLRDYAYENWEDDTYGEDLDEIGVAIDFIKSILANTTVSGSAEIAGKKYLIMEVENYG